LHQPIIAVTGPAKGGLPPWLAISTILKSLGAKPLRITPANYTPNIKFDGLIISGGSDVHPSNCIEADSIKPKRKLWVKFAERLIYPMLFFSRLTSGENTYDINRDNLELEMFKQAVKNKKPVLGICRGHQLINAARGGKITRTTLHKYKNSFQIMSVLPRKTIKYTSKAPSELQIKLNSSYRVNAIHQQAVETVGKGLEVLAVEGNGIIQATQSVTNDPPILSVQWHPEYLTYMPTQRNYFKWLITQTTKNNARLN